MQQNLRSRYSGLWIPGPAESGLQIPALVWHAVALGASSLLQSPVSSTWQLPRFLHGGAVGALWRVGMA